jgi:hypothetical protein
MPIRPTSYAVIYQGEFDVSVVRADQAVADAIAYGSYQASLESIGWDIFKVETVDAFPDVQQAFAAGYLEGYCSAFRIWPHADNLGYFSPIKEPVATSLKASMHWLDSNVPALAEIDEYWMNVYLLWQYFNGMHAGIDAANVRPGECFCRERLFQTASLADISDLTHALTAAEHGVQEVWRSQSVEDFEWWFHENTHCSALFKSKPDLSDVFHGHCTWIFWPWMSRIYKHLTLNYNSPSSHAKTVSMSSWAGALSSMDDFYQTSTGLTVLETSIQVFNEQLWLDGEVGQNPANLLYWIRAMVANRMATDARSWMDVFGRNNGGTYNNEWYVLDRKKFSPGDTYKEGLLTAINQLPGSVMCQDMSAELQQGYVASYNVPVIKEVFDLAGYPQAVIKHGPDMLSYENCARARIFQRDHAKVEDLFCMRHLMQYNDYENDLISKGNPMYAIASRGDKQYVKQAKLRKHTKPRAFGAIDAKVSTISLADVGVVEAFSGPTPQQGVFCFNEPWVKVGPHTGVPECPDFEWQVMSDE